LHLHPHFKFAFASAFKDTAVPVANTAKLPVYISVSTHRSKKLIKNTTRFYLKSLKTKPYSRRSAPCFYQKAVN